MGREPHGGPNFEHEHARSRLAQVEKSRDRNWEKRPRAQVLRKVRLHEIQQWSSKAYSAGLALPLNLNALSHSHNSYVIHPKSSMAGFGRIWRCGEVPGMKRWCYKVSAIFFFLEESLQTRKLLSVTLGELSPDMALWPWTCSSQNWETNFYCLSYPDYGILLWQPTQIKKSEQNTSYIPKRPLLKSSLESKFQNQNYDQPNKTFKMVY